MAVQTKKMSKTRSRRRHSAWQNEKIEYRFNKIKMVWSKEGKVNKMAYTVCPVTGMYKGKQVMSVKVKDKGTVVDAD